MSTLTAAAAELRLNMSLGSTFGDVDVVERCACRHGDRADGEHGRVVDAAQHHQLGGDERKHHEGDPTERHSEERRRRHSGPERRRPPVSL